MLTDEEILQVVGNRADIGDAVRIARAVIAAYAAKLREEKPTIYIQPNHLGLAKHQVFLCRAAPCQIYDDFVPLFEHPAPIPEGWISVNDRLPKIGRTPILVAVSWVKYGEHEDGTPTEATGVDVTEGEYVPAHGEAGGYFDSYQGRHGDSQYITHWQPLPKPPTAAARSGE